MYGKSSVLLAVFLTVCLSSSPVLGTTAQEPDRGSSTGFHPGQYVEAFGLATLSSLFVTFCFGFFMKKNPKVLLKWHKRLAYVTIIVASCHATLVMLAHNH